MQAKKSPKLGSRWEMTKIEMAKHTSSELMIMKKVVLVNFTNGVKMAS